MSLIINASAQADFDAEGVDQTSVMSYFNMLMTSLVSAAQLEELSFDSSDPSMPSWINLDCSEEWTATYDDSLSKVNQSNIDKLNIQSFSMISNLFYLTQNAPLSRQDIIDQLTETLSSFYNTAVDLYFAAMQE